MINQKYSADFSQEASVEAVYIRNNYQDTITRAAASVSMDPNWIIGFMIIESGTGTQVNPNAKSSAGALGLMQMMPASAYDVITNQAPVMTGEQVAVIEKYLPGFIKVGGFTGMKSYWLPKITDALTEAEFNIWVGAIQLAQLMMYIYKKTGDIKMDQVVVAYNAGQGNYQKYVYKKDLSQSDTATLVQNFPFAETRDYIVKLLGVDGSMMAALRTQ